VALYAELGRNECGEEGGRVPDHMKKVLQ
jgi:hypothetical protein